MVLEFDCRLYCDNLKETKPPYKCPLEECDKVYKTFQGIQYHLFNFHNNSARKPQRSGGINKRTHHRHLQNSVSSLESVRPPVQEVLSPRSPNGTNEQTVEINFDGKLQKINIYEALEVATKEKDDDAIQSANSISQQENSQAIESTKAPPVAKFQIIDRPIDLVDQTEQTSDVYHKYIEKSVEELEQDVEYLTDEEDYLWLEILNGHRRTQLLEPIKLETFELAMDRFEKAAFFYSRMHAEKADRSIDEDAICSICLDGECQNSNAILFCDLCNLAVHQECYGVPYVPDGQWLCRRCLHSPSRVVECFLCPNRGGAFKQTVDGRWAHVVCAMWIPEVCFANAVFLEPIDGIENIPRARWRLTCYVCRQRHAGACIQCHRPNCYTAFHVTCAQHAGLHIRIAPVRETSTDGSSSLAVRKAAYCDIHAPQPATSQNVLSLQAGDSDDSRMANTSVAEMKVMSQDKMRHARSVLMEWRKIKPVISFPVISQDSLSSIAQKLNLKPNDDFLLRLKGYWMLKRQSRSGTSLLRRLQTNHVTKIKEQEKSVDDFDCSPDEYSKDVCSKISSEDASRMSANVSSRILEGSQVLSGSKVEKIHVNGRRVQSVMNNVKNRSLNKKLEDVDNMGYIQSSKVLSDNSMKIQIKKSRSRKQKNNVELDSEKMMEIPENISEDLRVNQVKKPRTIKRKLQDEDTVMEVGQKPAKRRKLNKLSAAKMNKEDAAVSEIKLNSVVDTDSNNMIEGDLKAGQERSNPFSKTVIDLSDFETINSNIWTKTVDIWETVLETGQPEERRQTKRRRNGSLIPYDGKTVDKIPLDTSLVVDTSIHGRRKNCSFASDEKDRTTFEGISIKTYLGRKKKGGIVPKTENKDVEGSTCALEDPECINAKTTAENIQTRESEELFTQHKYWKRLRQDLERIRLLAELIRKREKLKLEQLQLQWDSIELQLKPFVTLLHKTLNQLEEKDTNKFFAEPVSNEEVPDYKEYIKNPMDFSTMRKKIDEHCYQTVADLAADFNLIIKNCMSYNGSHTVYYHAAYKLKRQAVGIIQAAKCTEAEVGYDPDTGLHLLDRPRPGEPEDEEGSSSFWNFMDGKMLENSSLEDQLRILLDRLNETTQAGHKGLNMHQQRRLKKEIVRVRRQMSALSSCSTMSPSSSKFNDSNITSASNDDTIGIPTTSFSIQPCSFITDTPSEASSTTLPVMTRHSATPSKSVTVTRSKARLLDADLSTSLTAVSRKTRARKKLQLKKDSNDPNDPLNSDEVGVGTSASDDQLLPPSELLLPSTDQLLPSSEQCLPPSEQQIDSLQIIDQSESSEPCDYRENVILSSCEQLSSCEPSLPSNEQLLASNEQLLASNEQLLPSNEQLLPSNEQLLASSEQLLASSEQLLASNEQLLASNEQLLASSEPSLPTNEKLSASNVEQDDDQEQKLLFDAKQIVLKPSSELLLPSAELQNNSSPSSDDRSDPSPSVDGKSDGLPSVDLYNDPVHGVDTVVGCNNGTNPVNHLDRVNPVVDSDQSPKSVNHSNQISVDHIDPAIAQLTVQDSGPTLALVIEQKSSSTLDDNLSSVLNEVATSSTFNLTVEAHKINESNASNSAHEITNLTVATNEVETLAQNSCSWSQMQTAENVSRQQSTESVNEDNTKTSEMLVAGGDLFQSNSVERSHCDVPQHEVKTTDSTLPENKTCNGKIVVEFLRDSLGLSSEKLSTELKNRKQAVDILSQEKATIKNNNCKNNISLDVATLEGALKHSELESSLEITNSSCAVRRTGKQSTVRVGSIDDDSDDIEVLIQTTNVKCEDEDSSENSSNTFDFTENIPSPDAQCNEHCIEDFDSKLNLRCGSNCAEPSRLNGLQLIVHLRNEPDNRPPNQYVTQTSKDSEYAETITSTDSEVIVLSDDETTKSSMVDAEITEATGNDLNGLVQSTERHFPTIDAPVQ